MPKNSKHLFSLELRTQRDQDGMYLSRRCAKQSLFCTKIPVKVVRQVALQFGIPRSTLGDRMRQTHSLILGRPNSLPMELERNLAKAVIRFCEKGCAMFVSELREIAVAYARTQLGPSCNFKASSTWIDRFIKTWELTEWETASARVLGFHQEFLHQKM